MSPPNQGDTNTGLESELPQSETGGKAATKGIKRTVYYSPQQVHTHNKEKDIWVIMNGAVYDITTFLPSHPGGEGIIMEHAGKDITEVFKSAADMLKGTKIGVLENATGEHNIFDTDNEYDNIIDLEKAVISQMWSKRLPLDVYLKLTHTPHFMKDGKIARLFENDFLEYCSQNSWYNVLIWIPVCLYLAYSTGQILPPATLASLLVAGVVIWSIVEYLIHRFIFHMDGLLPDHHLFICLHFLLHGVHHFLPMDRMRLVFPPTLAIFVLSFFYFALNALFPDPYANALLAGGLAGYITYDLGHYYVHHAVPQFEYLKELKSYHLDHHYKNYHLGYGVSSKAWDVVFGTLLPPS